jgi:hypothetical protein
MGVRSFLIAFNNLDEIRKFFEIKDKLASVLSELDISGYDCESCRILIESVVKSTISGKIQCTEISDGDWNLDLVGFNCWKGLIWGLVSTRTMGEMTMRSVMEHVLPNNYWSRLWNIDMKQYREEEHNPVENDVKKAVDCFERLSKQHDMAKSRQIYDKYVNVDDFVEHEINFKLFPFNQEGFPNQIKIKSKIV